MTKMTTPRWRWWCIGGSDRRARLPGSRPRFPACARCRRSCSRTDGPSRRRRAARARRTPIQVQAPSSSRILPSCRIFSDDPSRPAARQAPLPQIYAPGVSPLRTGSRRAEHAKSRREATCSNTSCIHVVEIGTCVRLFGLSRSLAGAGAKLGDLDLRELERGTLSAPAMRPASARSRACRSVRSSLSAGRPSPIGCAFTSRTKASWMKGILSRTSMAAEAEVAISSLET